MSAVLKAVDPVYGGYVIGRQDGVVFIKGAIPGETVEIVFEEKKRDYTIATVTEVIEPSPFRVEPECPYFGRCGGCQLQHVSYDKQVSMKNQVLTDCLKRIAKFDIELMPAMYGTQFGYRRRGQFKVSRASEIGFYADSTRDVVPVERCPLMCAEINDALRRLAGADLGGIRELHMTAGSDSVLLFVKGAPFEEALADRLLELGFGGVAFDDGGFRGTTPPYVTLDLNGLKYTVSPWSFMQSNWELNRELAREVASAVGETKDMNVLDLYAGGGNFSLALAIDAASVLAIEEGKNSAADGRRNASSNRITGYKFVAKAVEAANLSGRFHAAVLDPPRAGLSREAMDSLLAAGPDIVAYVSCNPSTLARDIERMGELYDVRYIRMVDMFPNTYHVEALCVLDKRSKADDSSIMPGAGSESEAGATETGGDAAEAVADDTQSSSQPSDLGQEEIL